jgi:hypothetical protein
LRVETQVQADRPEDCLTPQDDSDDPAARVERALERIALLSRPRPDVPQPPDATGLADRLDTLIAQLRAAIGPADTQE